ncbi:MAG: transposase [Anaerolineae bacterium]|nr:transposase [Anaerolineae bacterium]
MPAARFIHLTPDQDQDLRKIEQNTHFRAKVRLRAQVLRLSHQGFNVEHISTYTGRSRTSIYRDFDRWITQGVLGLTDGTAPGKPEIITSEMRTHLQERLQDKRAWTASQLADELNETFGVRVTPEAIRLRLRELGYCWKRTKYVPCKEIDPAVLHEHRASLETLKRGRVKDA